MERIFLANVTAFLIGIVHMAAALALGGELLKADALE